MNKLILIVALLPSMAMAAEQQKKPVAEQQKKPAQATGNPCAQYGAGFVQLQGTNTCVKLSGSVRVEIGR